MIARQIPDYRDRLFYVSGSPALIQSTLRSLRDLGVKPDKIKRIHSLVSRARERPHELMDDGEPLYGSVMAIVRGWSDV